MKLEEAFEKAEALTVETGRSYELTNSTLLTNRCYVERSGWIIHPSIIIGNNRRDYLRPDDIARDAWEVEDYSDIFDF